MPLRQRALHANGTPPIGADLPLCLLRQGDLSSVRRLAQLSFWAVFFDLRRTHYVSFLSRRKQDLLRPVRHDAYIPIRGKPRLRLRDGSEPGRSGGVRAYLSRVDGGEDQLGPGKRRTAAD